MRAQEDKDQIALIAHQLILDALQFGASDIHIEPKSQGLLVRHRLDGVLHHARTFSDLLGNALIVRLKEMAGLDVTEKRTLQEGKIQINLLDKDCELRVICVPTFFGEKIVMRVVDESAIPLNINILGFDPAILIAVQRILSKPSGLVIAAGRAGAGKTTFLNACLPTISSPAGKVVTMAALRDLNGAKIAVEAALKGRFVMGAIHTNDATSTLRRLEDMGVDPALIAPSVTGIVSLCLVRRLCPVCKTGVNPGDASIVLEEARRHPAFGDYGIPENSIFYEAVGCAECQGAGYCGRIGIQEVLECDAKLVTQILQAGNYEKAREIAVRSGMRTLLADGVRKAAAGITSIEEVRRVTFADF